jgi:hypothetical protein
MKIDVYHHIVWEADSLVEKKLDKILAMLNIIQRKEDVMSVELDALTVQVQANTDLEGSAIQLIQGLANQILALKDDPVKIAALSVQLKSSADALASAITANTPAVPPA